MPDGPGRVRQSVYWRRRATVLALGFGVVSLVVWAVSGLLGGGPHAGSPAAAATGRASGHGQGTQTGTASAGATPAGIASAGATPAGTPSAAATPSTSPPAAAGGHHSSGKPPAGVPAACKPRDVVVSLTSDRGSYRRGVNPHFTVYLVSVGDHDCSVNVGPGHLSVVIKSGGNHRIWDSADCARAKSHFVQLSRGVPQVRHFSWNRKGSSPGCQLATASAHSGTYTATAVVPAAHLASRDRVFVLRGRGTAMP
ncbi:MAG: hypothetical protein J2P34_09620 [Actinobacteria bacterium]|nr:hypothetical protein [Actinomycetota bacterium]